jgi:hypothetical protein
MRCDVTAGATCPKCGERVARGALRCRRCSADARTAQPTTGIRSGFALDEILAPESPRGRALELLAELERISPELYRWLGARKGPQPLADARAVELLEQARQLMGI